MFPHRFLDSLSFFAGHPSEHAGVSTDDVSVIDSASSDALRAQLVKAPIQSRFPRASTNRALSLAGPVSSTPHIRTVTVDLNDSQSRDMINGGAGSDSHPVSSIPDEEVTRSGGIEPASLDAYRAGDFGSMSPHAVGRVRLPPIAGLKYRMRKDVSDELEASDQAHCEGRSAADPITPVLSLAEEILAPQPHPSLPVLDELATVVPRYKLRYPASVPVDLSEPSPVAASATSSPGSSTPRSTSKRFGSLRTPRILDESVVADAIQRQETERRIVEGSQPEVAPTPPIRTLTRKEFLEIWKNPDTCPQPPVVYLTEEDRRLAKIDPPVVEVNKGRITDPIFKRGHLIRTSQINKAVPNREVAMVAHRPTAQSSSKQPVLPPPVLISTPLDTPRVTWKWALLSTVLGVQAFFGVFCVCFGCYLAVTGINVTPTVAILCVTGCSLAVLGVFGFLTVRKKQMRRALFILAAAVGVQLAGWLILTQLSFSDSVFVVEVCAVLEGATYLLCLLGSVAVLVKKQRLYREKQQQAAAENEAKKRLQLQLEQSKQARHLSEKAAKVLALHLRSARSFGLVCFDLT